VIDTYKCPSETWPDTFAATWNGTTKRGIGNYLGNAGGDLMHDNTSTSSYQVDARISNGVLLVYNMVSSTRRRAPIPLAAIIDGTSNTVLAGEAQWWAYSDPCGICDRSYLYSYNVDADKGYDYSEFLGSTYYPLNRSLIDPAAPGAPGDNERELSFGSYHPGGCNVALSDGSTRFVGETIEIDTWRAVGSRGGRESVGVW
jgi:hypothetical protein